MIVHWTEQEEKCIRFLAEQCETGKHFVPNPNELMYHLGGDKVRYEAIMALMDDQGFIVNPSHTSTERYSCFTIDPGVVHAWRAINRRREQEQQPGDIVKQVTDAIRRRPWTAWPIIVLLAITAVMTFLNQTLGVVKNLVDLLKGSGPK